MTAWRYPINSLRPHIKNTEHEILDTIKKVVSSGWFVLGPELEQFENDFAAYIGVKYCQGVANGTDAIEIALKATDTKKGEIVATSANAGMYSTSAINAIGATPLYTDVCPRSHCISQEQAAKAIHAGAKTLILTHLYGLAAPQTKEIADLCKEAAVTLIEDCAQAHGSKLGGSCVGTFGDAASFSFYPTKNLGCIGDGGAILSNSREVSSRAKQLRQYGWETKYQVNLAGGRNSRLDEVQAAVLKCLLPQLNRRNEQRRQVANHYSRHIHHPDIQSPDVRGDEYVAHLYVIQTPYRDALREHLENHEIQTDIHYPVPDHKQGGSEFKAQISLPVTERLAKQVLSIPCFPEMTLKDAQTITQVINAWKP